MQVKRFGDLESNGVDYVVHVTNRDIVESKSILWLRLQIVYLLYRFLFSSKGSPEAIRDVENIY